jgi:hypothetical protein
MLHNMQLIAFTLVLLLIGATSSSPIEQRQAIPAGCTNITIPVTVSAENLVLPPDLGINNFIPIGTPLLSTLFDQFVSGTFDIAATYCEPVNPVAGREDTLQILVHGITYTKACKKDSKLKLQRNLN